ncbi:SO2930 family diheme c-type cytochrome [Pendulispora albinea]|uniref:Cytochrome c domain-containing protein n=1 Tax=Pendulispora albinea TaxID=2741071 RepID=A0ABZ2LNQ8_9BACT
MMVMANRIVGFAAAMFVSSLVSCSSSSDPPSGPPAGGDGSYVIQPYETLEEYGLVRIQDGAIVMAKESVHYDLNTPLFSDYAVKERSIYLPRGTSMTYRDDGIFDFPPGAILTKSFGFPKDFRDPKSKVTWIETRLFIRTSTEWRPMVYSWDTEQKRAVQAPGGKTLPIEFIDASGAPQRANYLVPNVNQCPKCHAKGEETVPIGIYAAQMNRPHPYEGGTLANQLTKWRELGLLQGAPASLGGAPRLVPWDDPSSGTVAERARSYLDGNCAYCHSATGEARTSGLFLDLRQTAPVRLGVCKAPVAAGRAGSGLEYDIVPGSPDKSILTFRMNSTEPSVAMPELGRSLIHKEAVSLIHEWIKGLQGSCAPGK